MNRKGFTLIEILVVVAIIAILTGSVLVGLGPAQRQGRDARRIGDLRQVQNALELYFAKCGYYPGGAQAGACGAYASIGNDWAALQGALTGSVIGVNSVPNDPSSGKRYIYGADGTGTSYLLEATLEDTNNPVLQQSYKTNENGVDCATAGHYCVKF